MTDERVPNDFSIMQAATHAEVVMQQCAVESTNSMNCAEDHRKLRDMLLELLMHRQETRALVEVPVLRYMLLEAAARMLLAEATVEGVRVTPTVADVAAELALLVSAARAASEEGQVHPLDTAVSSLIHGQVLPAIWPQEVQV